MNWLVILAAASTAISVFSAGAAYEKWRAQRDNDKLKDKIMDVKGWIKTGPGTWEKAEDVDLP